MVDAAVVVVERESARANGVRERESVRVQNAAPIFFFCKSPLFYLGFKYVCFFLYLIRDLSPFFDPTAFFSFEQRDLSRRAVSSLPPPEDYNTYRCTTAMMRMMMVWNR